MNMREETVWTGDDGTKVIRRYSEETTPEGKPLVNSAILLDAEGNDLDCFVYLRGGGKLPAIALNPEGEWTVRGQ